MLVFPWTTKDYKAYIARMDVQILSVEPSHTFSMRWTCSGVTVEKIYPFSFNKFDKVLLLDEYKVRQSKLYYMRDKIGKDARLKSIISAENRDVDLVKKSKTFEAPKATEVKEEKAAEAPVEEAAATETSE